MSEADFRRRLAMQCIEWMNEKEEIHSDSIG